MFDAAVLEMEAHLAPVLMYEDLAQLVPCSSTIRKDWVERQLGCSSWGGLNRSGLQRVALQPVSERAQRELALESMPFFAIPNFMVERRQKVKRDICRLKVFAFCQRDVVDKRAKRRCSRRRRRFVVACQRGRVHACHEAGGNRFDVTFDAADLSREQYVRMRLHLQG